MGQGGGALDGTVRRCGEATTGQRGGGNAPLVGVLGKEVALVGLIERLLLSVFQLDDGDLDRPCDTPAAPPRREDTCTRSGKRGCNMAPRRARTHRRKRRGIRPRQRRQDARPARPSWPCGAPA